jgi:CBS domain containing-hemolysin-like protein/mannitol/fructose-specific phosphotransferase system IIA component (Ntr-type)
MPHALLIAALLIGLNALFVLMEYALVRVRPSLLEVLSRRGNSRALRVIEMQKKLDHYLAAIQLGMTLIAIALGWIAQPNLAALIARHLKEYPRIPLGPEALTAISLTLALAFLTWLHVLFGELLPRGIALQRSEPIALWGALPLKLFTDLFRWPIAFMSFCSMSALKILGLKPAGENDPIVGEEEMRVLLYSTQEKGSIPIERLLLIENLFNIGQTTVAETMTPKEEIAALYIDKSWQENLHTIQERSYSRYPLCYRDLDNPVGIIHIKDIFLREASTPPDLNALKRSVSFVSESEPLDKLLKIFPDRGIHLALVKNDKGLINGLITLEDIVEELIGEVKDEFDRGAVWSLTDSLSLPAVAVGVEALDRKSVIAALAKILAGAHPELDARKVFDAAWERELKFSSGLGRGIAFPHARLLELKNPMIAVARFAKPVAFPSPDNIPVRLAFLILTPASIPVFQLQILNRLATFAFNEGLRKTLLAAKTPGKLFEALCAADTLTAN